MRNLTSKVGGFLSQFEKIRQTRAEIIITSLKNRLFDDHEEANRGKIKGQFSLEHRFGFCKTF